MTYQGTIIRWNDERGFGFIREESSTAEIFAHISSFAQRAPRPQTGERVTFTLIDNAKGRKEAKNIRYLDRPAPPRPSRPRQHTPSSNLKPLFITVCFIIIAAFAYRAYQAWRQDNHSAPLVAHETSAPANFTCDGRKYCSQMTSCAEAKNYLKYCPAVEMDGDHDGIPCESQWCQ